MAPTGTWLLTTVSFAKQQSANKYSSVNYNEWLFVSFEKKKCVFTASVELDEWRRRRLDAPSRIPRGGGASGPRLMQYHLDTCWLVLEWKRMTTTIMIHPFPLLETSQLQSFPTFPHGNFGKDICLEWRWLFTFWIKNTCCRNHFLQ